MDEHMVEKLLSSLHAGHDLARVSRKCGLSLRQVAMWSASRHGGEAICALKKLMRARSALAVSRARAEAARALVKLAHDAEAKETARKACVDLLRLDDAGEMETISPDDDAPLDEEERLAWLAALERIGRDDATATQRIPGVDS